MRRDDEAPSWTEIAAMIGALNKPAPAPAPEPVRETFAGKWLLAVMSGLAVLFLGGIGTYAGSSIAGVGGIGPKIDAVNGQLTDLKRVVDTINTQSIAQQVLLGKQDTRLTTLEQNQARLMDRVRTLEGGPRIAAPAPGSVVAP